VRLLNTGSRRVRRGVLSAISPRHLLLFGVPAIAIAGAVLFWLSSGRYVSTENAYVKAHVVQIAPEIAGRIIEVAVQDHKLVEKDELLFKIDPEPYQLALVRAEAELDQARTQVESFRAILAEARSELVEAQGRVSFFEMQLQRQRQLAVRNAGAATKLDEAESNALSARDHVAVAEAKIARTLTALAGNPLLPAEQHAMVRDKQAARDRAALELARSTVRAPVAGVAVNVRMQLGEQVKVATPVFAIVDSARPWVEANFKETDLAYVRPGQKATLTIDIYPDVVWDAEVESISPATGAEFSILPPQNASGNWVKVVQRLPVRLRLLPRANEPPLRTGVTATVSIDTNRPSKLASWLASGQTFAQQRDTAK
jgi:membrane fusion protein, multidrug efflux system